MTSTKLAAASVFARTTTAIAVLATAFKFWYGNTGWPEKAMQATCGNFNPLQNV